MDEEDIDSSSGKAESKYDPLKIRIGFCCIGILIACLLVVGIYKGGTTLFNKTADLVSEVFHSDTIDGYSPGTYYLNSTMKVRCGPGLNYEYTTMIDQGKTISVSKVVKDSDDNIWGKIGNEQYVCIRMDTTEWCTKQ